MHVYVTCMYPYIIGKPINKQYIYIKCLWMYSNNN